MLFQTSLSAPDLSLVIHTPAKLNLFLDIKGRRADGYHELETVMVSLNLYDTLMFTDLTEDLNQTQIELNCLQTDQRANPASSPDLIPTGADNLIVKAASLLKEYAGVQRGAKIHLVKRIPAAAGMGGGSSDALATLVGLNRLWDLRLPVDELHTLAARLGSDLNFFLSPWRYALCCGRGEQIAPVRGGPNLHFVIVRPSSGLATRDVFRAWNPEQTPSRPANQLLAALHTGSPEGVAYHLHNSLQHAATQLNSEVRQLQACFSRLNLPGHGMSGSGTAWFALCKSRPQAAQVAARLRAQRFGRVYVARSLC